MGQDIVTNSIYRSKNLVVAFLSMLFCIGSVLLLNAFFSLLLYIKLNPPQDAPEPPKYAPKEFREERLPGHLTRAGRVIQPGTTPPATPAADPSGLTAATSAGPTVDTPACTPA